MRQTRLSMGMPITVEVVDGGATLGDLLAVFDYFDEVDARFSTYRPDSEISALNRGELTLEGASAEMRQVFALAEATRRETDGYFDIRRNSGFDPSGLVKGWAIYHAAEILKARGFDNYYVDAGGDIQVAGRSSRGEPWRVGIRSPFNTSEIVKVLELSDCGLATSGTYGRGQHIYNPKAPGQLIADVASLTVVGPNVYEADRFATACFAMGRAGISFIARLDGFEGYLIDAEGRATYTPGFERYVTNA